MVRGTRQRPVVGGRGPRREHANLAHRLAPALSASFHGRDLFAPVAAWVASGNLPADKLQETQSLAVHLGAEHLPEIIYVDHYGNALTGLRASALARTATIAVRKHRVSYARVFADAAEGEAFWYENSIGLVEIAASRASAADMLGVEVGDPLTVIA